MAAEPQKAEGSAERRTYRVVDFSGIVPVPCPCGTARRALGDEPAFPGSLHVTRVEGRARPHFHRHLTETYYILACDPDATIRLDDDRVALRPGMAIVIPPGTVHAIDGGCELLNIVVPAFDPSDEQLVDD
ncbi:MAG TPA: cupin [Planctomycetaceae bacterium]|nr:cupin [Planctomycetaceae bacterium]HRF00004.1 cupin domain-containing protein [Pirellulaceae bacterium]